MKGEERVLNFLRGGGAVACEASQPGAVLLDGGGRGAVAVSTEAVRRLLKRGTVVETGGALRLASGISGDLPAAVTTGTRELELVRVEDPAGGTAEVCVNHAESPLGALMRRKGKDGVPFLSQAEFGAGERLRSDYSRGALMPRLGMNWSAPVASGKRGSGGGIAELTDAALSARVRVDRALRAVGPELAGVLVDVCCFLKGLEQVERERGWPVRSAKIMLKTGLASLARHYDPQSMRGEKAGAVLHWGTGDYRPASV